MSNKMKTSYYSWQLKLWRPLARIFLSLEEKLNHKLYIERFDHREDDIFVVTYMKSGTTLIQNILYQMLHERDSDFDHIYDVSPWFEQSMAQNQSLTHFSSPRIIKTHSGYGRFPKEIKGKIIYGIRDGLDVAVSKYHHFKNYRDPSLDWNRFLQQFFTHPDHWFKHVADWVKNENRYKIHYVYYQDLITDKEKVVKEIAAFLGVNVSAETLARVLEKTSFQYMKANERKFGEQPDRRIFDQFIRRGELNTGKDQFNKEQVAAYNELRQRYLSGLGLKL